jgi:hypothetical protein
LDGCVLVFFSPKILASHIFFKKLLELLLRHNVKLEAQY